MITENLGHHYTVHPVCNSKVLLCYNAITSQKLSLLLRMPDWDWMHATSGLLRSWLVCRYVKMVTGISEEFINYVLRTERSKMEATSQNSRNASLSTEIKFPSHLENFIKTSGRQNHRTPNLTSFYLCKVLALLKLPFSRKQCQTLCAICACFRRYKVSRSSWYRPRLQQTRESTLDSALHARRWTRHTLQHLHGRSQVSGQNHLHTRADVSFFCLLFLRKFFSHFRKFASEISENNKKLSFL